jgi:ferritin-like metal-binding protein YciE
MAERARDVLVDGLRNAHAMETQPRELMERQSERTDDFPELQQRLRQHLQETSSSCAELKIACINAAKANLRLRIRPFRR